MIRNQLVLFGEFFREFRSTGAFCETSKWAAKELTLPLRKDNKARRILEVGAGTGPVTRGILSQMNDGDVLVTCEINPRLCVQLRKNLAKDPAYARHQARVQIVEGPIQQLESSEKFDLIVCALPFLNFEKPLVEEIFKKLESLSVSETLMTYYEFTGLRELGKRVSSRARRERIIEIENFLMNRSTLKRVNKRLVLLNVPPINVYTMRLVA